MTFLDRWHEDAKREQRDADRDYAFIYRQREVAEMEAARTAHAAPQQQPRATTQADVLAAIQALHADVTTLRAEVYELRYEVWQFRQGSRHGCADD